MSSVWVQLFYKGKNEPEGHPVEIIPIPRNIGALIEAVKTKLELDARLNLIFACPPGTTPPFSEQTSIRGDKILKELIDELGNKNPRMSICYDHPLILVAPAPAAGAAVQNANFVFVLYQQTGMGPDPIATAFAVSDSLLLTAAHNVVTREDEDKSVDIEKVDDAREQKEQTDDMVVDNLMISPMLLKSSDGTIRAEEGRRVEVFRYHYHHDWAFLKVCDSKLADFIPLAREINELPERGTKEKMDVFNCTVKIFRDARREATLHAFPKEVGVGTVGEKFMSFQNGGFKGSCGGPYIFRNKAVALHVESHNDAYDYEMLEEQEEEEIQAGTRSRKRTKLDRTLEVAESTVSSHSSIGTGLILQARSGLMKVFNGEMEDSQVPSAGLRNRVKDFTTTRV